MRNFKPNAVSCLIQVKFSPQHRNTVTPQTLASPNKWFFVLSILFLQLAQVMSQDFDVLTSKPTSFTSSEESTNLWFAYKAVESDLAAYAVNVKEPNNVLLSKFRLYKVTGEFVDIMQEDIGNQISYALLASQAYVLQHYVLFENGSEIETFDYFNPDDFFGGCAIVPCEARIFFNTSRYPPGSTFTLGNPGQMFTPIPGNCYTLWNVNTYVDVLPYTVFPPGGVPMIGFIPNTIPVGIYVGNQPCAITNLGTQINVIDGSPLFPAGVSNGLRVSIRGQLDITTNYTFSNSDICMHSDAAIRYTNNLTLNVNQVHDRRTPDGGSLGAWNAIIATGTASLSATTNTFQGAYSALNARGLANTYALTNNVFIRNFIGIRLTARNAITTFNTNKFLTDAQFSVPAGGLGCGFTNGIPKPQGTVMFAGVYVEANRTFDLPTSSVGNIFDQIANGVYLEDANTRIHGCQFRYMQNGAYVHQNGGADDGRGVVQFARGSRRLTVVGLGRTGIRTFIGCRTAILSQNIGTNVLNVSNCWISDVSEGISLVGNGSFPNSFITNNTIGNFTSFGIQCINLGKSSNLNINTLRAAAGVGASQCIGILDFSSLVSNSTPIVTITNNRTSAGNGLIGALKGISISNAANIAVLNNDLRNQTLSGVDIRGSRFNQISCNTSDRTTTSTAFSSALWSSLASSNNWVNNTTGRHTIGLLMAGASNPSDIMCNTFGQARIGVDYTAMASNSMQRVQVGPTQFQSHGNVWIGPFSQWAANGNGMAGTPIANRFSIRTNELPNFRIVTTPSDLTLPPTMPQLAWFLDEAVGSIGCPTTTCVQIITEDGRVLSTDDRTKMAASGSYSDLTSYLDLKNLYADAKLNTNLQNDADALGFVQTKASTNYGRATNIASQVAGLEQNASDVLTIYHTQAAQLFGVIDQLDIELENGTSTIDAQLAQRNNLNDQLLQIQAEIASNQQQSLNTKLAVKQNLLVQLSAITPQFEFDAADKQLLELYIQSAFVQVPLTTSQKMSLFTLAQMCEHIYGTAVFQARAWYLAETGDAVDGNCDDEVGARSSDIEPNKHQTLNTVRISPNPVRQNFTIDLSWKPSAHCTAQVVNALGQIVKTLQIAEGNGVLEVVNLNLTAGIYKLVVYEHDVATAQTTLNISE
jgi:hypothetical protein